jgi:hypothetical protein
LANVSNEYKLAVVKKNQSLKLAVVANDSSHAQAQALDIRRAFGADSVVLFYGSENRSDISTLFKKLALNEFDYKNCSTWEGKHYNQCPCIYVFKTRFYIRPLILNYLDIPDSSTVRMTCGNPMCVNPYHFSYVRSRNAKLSSGDISLVLAYHRQGASVKQIAAVLNVHRSTIYRTLNNECFSSRSSSDGSSPN